MDEFGGVVLLEITIILVIQLSLRKFFLFPPRVLRFHGWNVPYL